MSVLLGQLSLRAASALGWKGVGTSACGSDGFTLAESCLCLSPGSEGQALPTPVTQAHFP